MFKYMYVFNIRKGAHFYDLPIDLSKRLL